MELHRTNTKTLVEEATEPQNLEPKGEVTPVATPTPELSSRIWPWPEADAWDARQVYREVVSALEMVKSGKTDNAASTIDTLGPHLTDDNIDMIYHIGMVLKQLGELMKLKECSKGRNQRCLIMNMFHRQ